MCLSPNFVEKCKTICFRSYERVGSGRAWGNTLKVIFWILKNFLKSPPGDFLKTFSKTKKWPSECCPMLGRIPHVYMIESIWFYTFQQSLGFGTPRRHLVGLAIYSKNDEISWFVSSRWPNCYLGWRKCMLYIIWHTKTVANHLLDMWMNIWNHFSNFWGVKMCIMDIFRNLKKSPGGPPGDFFQSGHFFIKSLLHRFLCKIWDLR